MNRLLLRSLCSASLLLVSTAALAGSPVNINTATADELAASLDGVGIAKATAIVEDRNLNGLFSQPDQIQRVSGIGASTYEKNQAFILIESRDPDAQ